MKTSRLNFYLGSVCCFLVGFFIVLPIISSFIFSLSNERFPTLPLGEFSLRWYSDSWNDPKDFAALWRTLSVGLSAAVMATVLGFCAAYTDYRWNFRGKSIFLSIILLPPTVPLVIFGIAMLAYLSRVGIAGRPIAIWVGHVVICLPFAMALIRLRLHQMDTNLEQAAWNLGASEWQAMRFVILPFCGSAIAAALFLALAVSFDEYAVAWFVSGIHETLPVRVLNFLQGQVSPRINVVGTFTFTATIFMVVIAEILMQKGARNE